MITVRKLETFIACRRFLEVPNPMEKEFCDYSTRSATSHGKNKRTYYSSDTLYSPLSQTEGR